MDKRRNPPDPLVWRKQREIFYEDISQGKLSLSEAVKRMRALSMLTIPEFAEHRGLSVKSIKELERGTANPTAKTLNQIGEIFGLEVAFVRKRTKNM
jgi:DNA-binding XRE family transcriptional regulator